MAVSAASRGTHQRWILEAGFCLDIAGNAVIRSDSADVSGCLFRAVLLCAHALQAHAGRWLVNEKGAVTAAGRLPDSPEHFTTRAQATCAAIGASKERPHATLTAGRNSSMTPPGIADAPDPKQPPT